MTTTTSSASSLPVRTLLALAATAALAACQPAAQEAASPAPAAAAPEAAPQTAAPETPAPAPAAVDAAAGLGDLAKFAGTYPHDGVNYLEQGALADRLKSLLGDLYPELLENLRTSGPLTEDAGRWFITGNRPHQGGSEAAAVVADPANNAVRVWLLHKGQAQEFVDPASAQVSWPQEVQTMLQNATAQ